jgi:hypothetical protein
MAAKGQRKALGLDANDGSSLRPQLDAEMKPSHIAATLATKLAPASDVHGREITQIYFW